MRSGNQAIALIRRRKCAPYIDAGVSAIQPVTLDPRRAKIFMSEGVDLPHQLVRRGFERRIVWRKPTCNSIHGFLTKLTYAGVYCYGQRRTRTDPISHQSHVQKCARETWTVFLPDHHPGYITLEEFEKNQKILENNSYQYPNSQGAARKGSALLPGLVFCQHCGRRMRVRYTLGKPYYTCDAAERRFAAPICNRASAS